jgi:hypothetical protein
MAKPFLQPGAPLATRPQGPVQVRFVENASGSAVEISVAYEQAEVPERRFYADYCDVVKARSGFSLVFGRLAPGTNTLRTQVEVSFPESLFYSQFFERPQKLFESVQEQVGKHALPAIDKPTETDKVQGFRANNVFMAILGEDAILDFYYISPSDIHLLHSGKKSGVYLEPIVRIVLATALMLEFLQKARGYAEGLPHSLRRTFEEQKKEFEP